MNVSKSPNRRDFFLAGRPVSDAIRRRLDDGADQAPSKDAVHQPYLVRLERRAMACEFAVYLNAGQYPDAPQAALKALDLIEQVEAQLTIYRDSSETSALNRTAGERAVEVAPELFRLLELAAELHEQTGGAWDPTTGPLTKAWGFDQRKGHIPDPEAMRSAMAAVGFQHVRLDRENRSVRFLRPGVELNFGSIGKGYALDRASQHLLDEGVDDFLWHGGQSSVLARGNAAGDENPDGGWWIGVSDPLKPGERIARVRLRDEALATSGSRVQYFRQEGQRFGHVLDPRTGQPATGVLSVTVVAPTAALADALSTAFYVLGPEKTEQHCKQYPGVRALVVGPNVDPNSERTGIAAFGFGDEQWQLEPGDERV